MRQSGPPSTFQRFLIIMQSEQTDVASLFPLSLGLTLRLHSSTPLT